MLPFLLFFTLIALLSFGASALLTRFVRAHLIKRAIMDQPNERSMHAVPVPRGGGLAVMSVVIGGMLAYAALSLSLPSSFLFLLPALFLLLAVSWIDDKKGLSARLRLGAHILAALIGSFALGKEATLFGDLLPFWLDRAVMVLGWAWFMNLTNFMDGIDGITGVQTITTAGGAGVLLWLTDKLFIKSGAVMPEVALAALLVGACAGFLIHNWHPAKIFLGDVGSVPLGFLTGFLLLRLAEAGFAAAALILPLYYLADSGITITRRAIKGEKIWQPHRQHFYQKAAAGEGRHDKIVLWILETNLLLVLLAGLSLFYPSHGIEIAIAAVALLLAKLHKSGRKVSP